MVWSLEPGALVWCSTWGSFPFTLNKNQGSNPPTTNPNNQLGGPLVRAEKLIATRNQIKRRAEYPCQAQLLAEYPCQAQRMHPRPGPRVFMRTHWGPMPAGSPTALVLRKARILGGHGNENQKFGVPTRTIRHLSAGRKQPRHLKVLVSAEPESGSSGPNCFELCLYTKRYAEQYPPKKKEIENGGPQKWLSFGSCPTTCERVPKINISWALLSAVCMGTWV